MSSQYSYVIINLFLVIALMFIVVFLIKKFKLGRYTENKYIKIHNMVSIGPKEKIILIEINKTALLLGATPNHIEMLYAFDELKESEAGLTARRPATCPRDPEYT